MNPFDAFRDQVLRQLSGVLDLSLKEIESILERPPEGVGADLALPCFFLSPKMRKDPRIIASDVAGRLAGKPSSLIADVRAIGPYVNFYADWDRMKMLLLKGILRQGDGYGSKKQKKPEKAMAEFCHANTHKAFHIGHVRNICLGESISRILEFSGSRVVRANYQGDIGPHVAKCIWGFKKLYKGKPPKNVDKGVWLGEVYAKANNEAAGNEKLENEIKKINAKLYAGDKSIAKIWKATRQWSLDYYDNVYKDFGVKFNRLYFESQVEKPGKAAAMELLKKGVARRSQGAVVMDFEKEGLGVLVLVTQDGAPLYGAKDLGLARLQSRERPDRILHIVGVEQTMYFRQLFRTLGLMEPGLDKKEMHVSYELVNLPTGKMSSRTGSVVTYDELRAKLTELARKVTSQKNPRLRSRRLDKAARLVALGALKYGMLSVSPEKVIVFDWDRALSFEGNSAPYIQYSHARACSILRKARFKGKGYDAKVLKNEEANALMKQLAAFPETVARAGHDLKPHYVASYAYELAVKFNDFYEKCPVLRARPKELRAARLALVAATRVVLCNALRLLGIEAPEKM